MEFAKFTDRSKEILRLARNEALENNFEFIGSQHLLYGVAKEGHGIGHFILVNHDITAEAIQKEIKKVIHEEKNVKGDNLQYNPKAIKILETAGEIAKSLRHNYVGTEHLLLAILSHCNDNVAGQIICNLGSNPVSMCEEILELLGFYVKKFTLKDSKIYQQDDVNTEPLCIGEYIEDKMLLKIPMELSEVERIVYMLRGS